MRVESPLSEAGGGGSAFRPRSVLGNTSGGVDVAGVRCPAGRSVTGAPDVDAPNLAVGPGGASVGGAGAVAAGMDAPGGRIAPSFGSYGDGPIIVGWLSGSSKSDR